MWSRSPSHTVAIFTTLKEGLSEPDALAAAAVGAPHAAAEGVFNMAPQDFLRSLPGVHPHNYRKLMNAVGNLQQLASQTLSGVARGAIAVGGDEASPACLPYGPLLAFDGHGGYLSGGVKAAEAKGKNDLVVYLCAPPPPPLVRARRGGRRFSAGLASEQYDTAYVASVAALDAHLRSTEPFVVATAFMSGSVRVLDVTAR